MVAIFDGSPMPNHRIRSGSSAILGIGNSADTIGMPAARAAEKMPMARPTARPAAVPMIQPGMMRFSEAVDVLDERAVEPQRVAAPSTTATGLGMKSGGSRPLLEAACQSAISTANTIHGSSRRGTGAKPPPRKGIGRRSPRSDMLASRGRRWRPRRGSATTAGDALAQQAGMFGAPALGDRHVDAR